jgi:hypothetical protein
VWAYGAGHTGGAAAVSFIPYCQAQGARLYPVDTGDPHKSIALAHQCIAAKKPVIFTQQDDYSSNPDFTHVCVWYKSQGDTLTMMDPWGAQSIMYTDDVWAERLRTTQLWIMERIYMLDPAFTDDGTTLKHIKSGFVFVHGFRLWVLAALSRGESPIYWTPLMNEKKVSQVVTYDNEGPGSIQIVYGAKLVYTVNQGVHLAKVGPELLKYMESIK